MTVLAISALSQSLTGSPTGCLPAMEPTPVNQRDQQKRDLFVRVSLPAIGPFALGRPGLKSVTPWFESLVRLEEYCQENCDRFRRQIRVN